MNTNSTISTIACAICVKGAGGIDLEQSADASVAAQTVADSAQTTADDLKEAVTTEGKT
jgi:hypothetical protein